MIVYYGSREKICFQEFFRASGTECIPLYRNKITRIIRKYLRGRVPVRMVYSFPQPAADDDKIIVFDSGATPRYLYWLCSRYPDKRILLWYWNPVENRRNFNLFPRRVEIWSYSSKDCAQYGFRYNSQFYFDCIADEECRRMTESHARPRVLFLGREKGRKQAILDIKAMLEKGGADTEFHFMRDGTKENRHAEPLMKYREVVEMIRRSDALLDYTCSPNAGLSLRPMEALFFGKKLITNQADIRGCDFYRKENIYILGEEERTLQEFFSEPYVAPEPEILDYYRISSWLKRFDLPEDEKP